MEINVKKPLKNTNKDHKSIKIGVFQKSELKLIGNVAKIKDQFYSIFTQRFLSCSRTKLNELCSLKEVLYLFEPKEVLEHTSL